MSRVTRLLAVAMMVSVVASSLVACSSKGKTRVPAKLVDIHKPELSIDDVWSRHVGKGSGDMYTVLRVAVGDGAVYAAGIDGVVEALEPDTGKVIWRTKTKARLIAGPAVSGDQVFVGTQDARAIALARADGKRLWDSAASSEVGAPPVAGGDTVVVRSVDGRVYGIDAGTGSRTWSFDRNEPNLTLRGLSAPLIVGRRVYVGLDNGHMVALNLGDGQLAWEQSISVPGGRTELDRLTDIDADLLEGPEGIFVVTYGSDLTLVEPSNGQSLWRRTVKSYTGMAYGGTRLFVSDSDGTVFAFDGTSGQQLWKQEGLKYRQLSPPAFFNGYVVVGDYKGYLHWLSPEDGHFVARTRLGGDPITAAPVAGSKFLYAMNTGGKVAAFTASPAK